MFEGDAVLWRAICRLDDTASISTLENCTVIERTLCKLPCVNLQYVVLLLYGFMHWTNRNASGTDTDSPLLGTLLLIRLALGQHLDAM